MNKNVWNEFEPLNEKSPSLESKSVWDEFEPLGREEGLLEKTGRGLYQLASGVAEVTPYGIGTSLWDLLGTGEALNTLNELNEERISELKKNFPSAPWENYQPINQEKYLEELQKARETIPTIANIEKFIGKYTGLPLEPKTFMDKLLRIAGSAGKLKTGGLGQKSVSGASAAATKATLQSMGVPEGVADVLSLGTSSVSPFEKVTGKSGIPKRWYEGLTKNTKVSPAQYNKIKEAVEGDVKLLSKNLVLESNRTARALEADPLFPQKIDNILQKTEKLASNLKETIPIDSVRRSLRKESQKIVSEGVTPSKYEKSFQETLKKLQKDLAKSSREGSIENWFKQYRKNNKSYGELYEPGSSSAANRGERDALAAYNKAISDAFEKKLPNSEFNKIFNFSNRQYSQLRDLGKIDEFFENIFGGDKINFNEAKKFFSDARTQKSFKNILGEDAFSDMRSIMNDFVTKEKAMKLVKKGESLGLGDVLPLMKKWMITPGFGKGSALRSLAVNIRNDLLSNQKFRVTWKNAVKDFKSGSLKKAVQGFKELDRLVEESKESATE